MFFVQPEEVDGVCWGGSTERRGGGYVQEHLFVLPINIWLLVISHDACSRMGAAMHSPLWAGM